jgi:hypothetical protein
MTKGGKCSTYGRGRCILYFGGETDGTIKHGRPENKWGNDKGQLGCRKYGNEPWASV